MSKIWTKQFTINIDVSTMITFSFQRQSPEMAQVEQRLLDIFNILGRSRIPELEFGDFCADLERNPGSGKSLETWEEQIGVRLGLRILDQVIFENFDKQEELSQTLTELKSEMETVEGENKKLREELETLKHSSETLEQENRRLKGELAEQMKERDHEALTSEITKDPSFSFSRPFSSSGPSSSVSLLDSEIASSSSKSPSENSSSSTKVAQLMRSRDPDHVTSLGKSEAGSRKRKTLSPQPPGVREKDDITALGFISKMSRKLSPTEALMVSASSTHLHTHDPNFVPDTLQVTEGLPAARSSSSRKHDQDDMKTTVPDTPEKSQDDPCPPSANIESFLSPMRPGTEDDKGPVSRLKQKSARLKTGRKLGLVHRKDVLRKNNFKEDTREVKAKKKLERRMKLAMRRKEAENRAPTSQVTVEGDMIIPVTGNNPKKVERITPSAQSEIDTKTFKLTILPKNGCE